MNNMINISLDEQLKRGLEEIAEYKQGKVKFRTRRVSVAPLTVYNADEIKNIRNAAGMTQVLFAAFLGVSVKTVEAWESGRNKPAGPACRLLTMTRDDPKFPEKCGVISG